ncbi:MAG: hypothetical protein QM233_03290 [Candidatus Cloacimonadota bacterium]|nr:hypothetical protein [Candidatus Cloacimonadota bacterium]
MNAITLPLAALTGLAALLLVILLLQVYLIILTIRQGKPGSGRINDSQASQILLSDLQELLDRQQSKHEDNISLFRNKADQLQEMIRIALVQSNKDSQQTERGLPDYRENLVNYLRQNHPDKGQDTLNLIQSVAACRGDAFKLKDLVINIAINTAFSRMSDTRKRDFCQLASDYLARDGLMFFTPRLGEEFNVETMDKQKQFSQSTKVSNVIYFGISHNGRTLVKAVVNVG